MQQHLVPGACFVVSQYKWTESWNCHRSYAAPHYFAGSTAVKVPQGEFGFTLKQKLMFVALSRSANGWADAISNNSELYRYPGAALGLAYCDFAWLNMARKSTPWHASWKNQKNGWSSVAKDTAVVVEAIAYLKIYSALSNGQ